MDTMMILSTLLPGTMSWTAPELLGAELPPTEESDIWSLGCVLYEVSFPNAKSTLS
jgi:serine/threonine protein kinase